jgi:hypothetical protein
MTATFNLSRTNDVAALLTFAFAFAIAWLGEIVSGLVWNDPHVLAVAALPALIAGAAVIGYTGTTVSP